MTKIFYTLLLINGILFGSLISLNAMEKSNDQSKSNFHNILLPGQNGLAGNGWEIDGIINGMNNDHSNITHIKTLLSWKIDLGQGNCVRDFDQKLNKKTSSIVDSKFLLYGISQGTATLINWLAQQSHSDQEKKIGCLFLQSVLGSGNSAIVHTLSNVPLITYLPFARALIPICAKFFFPTYNPLGKSVFKSASKISPNIPVIIMHCTNDPQLSINDARNLYCILKKSSNNVYLFENDHTKLRYCHFDTLRGLENDKKIKKITALQAIYKKHNVPYSLKIHDVYNNSSINDIKYVDVTNNTLDNYDLNPYQPSVEEVQQKIHESTHTARTLRNGIDITSGCLLLGGLCTYLYQKGILETAYAYTQ